MTVPVGCGMHAGGPADGVSGLGRGESLIPWSAERIPTGDTPEGATRPAATSVADLHQIQIRSKVESGGKHLAIPTRTKSSWFPVS